MIGFCFIFFLLTARDGCHLSGSHTNKKHNVVCTVLRFVVGSKEDKHGHHCQQEKVPPKLYGPPWHGEWQKYIRAPEDKSHILPERIYKVRGNVSTSSSIGSRSVLPGDDFEEVTGQGRGDGILLGMGGSLTVAFKENIGGRICLDIDSIGTGSEKEGVVTVTLGYSESPWYAGPVPDATGDRQDRDLPLRLKLKGGKTGKVCVGKDFVRGSFKYFTISVPVSWAALGEEQSQTRQDRHWLRIKSLWAVLTSYPDQKYGQNYTGYFHSSNDLLNRIWYSGAWTLQLSTIDPKQGSSLIDYNRQIDHNNSPQGSWYSNFTISNGTSVTTDGAKRDRMVWPGDMFIAIPGIAVSTNDMPSVRNALDVLYNFQYEDGSLPYAGPPMGYHREFSDTYHLHTLLGTYNYVLYSGDLKYLRSKWNAYQRALSVSIAKVDSMGLLHVSSVADWLRPGLTGHNVEASAILYTTLSKSIVLANWLSDEETDIYAIRRNEILIDSWRKVQKDIEKGLARLYCPSTGLFSDNIGQRSCKGAYHVDPQDGNSWVLISGLDLSESNLPFTDPKSEDRESNPLPEGVPSAQNISDNLVKRWTKFGAPAPEFPNVISPFASGFELLAHAASGNISAAVELMLLEWGYLLDGPGFTNSTLAEGFRVDGHMQYPAYPSAARNSHAHGWSSGPTSVLINSVVGIQVTKYGGSELVVNPRLPGWLSFVRGGFELADGWVEILVWRIKEWVPSLDNGTGIIVTVTIPKQTVNGVAQFGGLFKDLWEDEMRKGHRVVPYPCGEEGFAKGYDRLRLGIISEFEVPGSVGRKSYWLRWARVESQNFVLKFDEDYVPLEMDTSRPPGVVDWDVMEENFRGPVYQGWRVDHLKTAAEREEEEEDLFARAMESGMGMDGDFEYLD
ncbi:Six-hairpin glycosidase-like protein [Rhypophila decipiens]